MVTRSKSLAKSKRTAKKPVSKRVPPSKVGSKTATKTHDRDTLVKLRAHVDDIEKRLKRANSLTRTSVRALKTSYAALDGDNQTSVLSGHIEQLSDHLTGMIEQTRKDVAHDLKIVLGDPRLETLSEALTKANQRLTSAEQNQSEAINAINNHISRLATAVDERMQREQRQREKGEAILTERMDTIEQDSADAIKTIGNKVVNISENLAQKAQTFRGELAEQALTRHQDYEEHKHEMARRIEAIEDEQRNQLPAFERGIEALGTRLEALESNVGMYEEPAQPAISAPAFETAPQLVENEQIVPEEVSHYENTKANDAFAALELVDMQEVIPPALGPEMESEASQIAEARQVPQTYAPVEYMANAAATAVDGQTPEVFSPRAYTPDALNQGALNQIQADVPLSNAVGDNDPQIYTPQMEATPHVYGEQVYDQAPPPMPAVAAVPEIHSLEPTMESVRPGAEPTKNPSKGKNRKSKKPKNGGGGSGGHGMIRKVALFGGVAVVALFAYKTISPKIFGAEQNTPLSAKSTPIKSLSTIKVSGDMQGGQEEYTTADGQVFETIEPVGDYSDTMSAPDLGGTGTEVREGQTQTLEVAAADGNAIAQFQLGLSHLEAGRDADAVRLIRLAANQGQPAAQYRLAKLYEAGIGVKVNGKTAKDLLSRSAKAGNRIAMHDLGHYYATGADGSAPDLQQAVKWFSQAAERGVLDSQFNLAVLYQGGSGVPLSLEDAYVWYSIAGAKGDKIAAQRSESVARELSKKGLDDARARVKAYAPKPVNNVANGVFKNLPWISVKAKPDAKATVKSAQKLLASIGYKVGTPDGAMGPNTRNAIISFERANGMPETGRVNAALIERLQLAAGV